MSGHESSSGAHRARPLTISRNSFANKGETGARRSGEVSGESKKDLLQVRARTIGSATQLFERTDTADSTVRQQGETITHLFGIVELMDRQQQRPATRRYALQHTRHVARLSEIEAVERLVHQQNRVSCQKSECDDQAAVIAFGQGLDALS